MHGEGRSSHRVEDVVRQTGELVMGRWGFLTEIALAAIDRTDNRLGWIGGASTDEASLAEIDLVEDYVCL